MRGTGWIRQGWVARAARSRWIVGWIALALLPALIPAAYLVLGRTDAPVVPKVRGAHGVHAVKFGKPVRRPDAAARRFRPGKVTWPAAHVGAVELTTGHAANVAGTPVSVRAVPPAKGAYAGPSSLTVNVAGHRAAEAAGVNGVAFTVTPRDGSGRGAGRVRVAVNYRRFASAYGGDFGARLHLSSLPACALTSPQNAGCRTPAPLPGGNDTRSGTVYADLPASMSRPMVLAATTSDSGGDGGGPAGTYGATDLKPSGTWSSGGSSGSFTYTYPVGAPPAASGLVPKLDLSYDSGLVDGQTAATQAQASWAGDGWSTPQSFIEQSFTRCSDSPEGSAAPSSTDDDCYDGPVLTLSLNGSSTALVWDAGKKLFKPAHDNGDVVSHITDSGNGSGTYNTDYWKVTDRTGTVYMFGRNRLPGWSSGDAPTNSVDSEPVFSAHSGDPCYKATWSDSWCTMAYRWNLDYVTDVHGNAMAYYYKQDTNAYAKNGDTSSATSYVRDSHLDHIDYGFTDGNAYSVNGGHAPDQVLFTTGDRCLSGTCDPLNKTNAVNWPDVPYDLHCDAQASCGITSPSLWSTVRLTGIKTQQWDGSAYAPVDSWKLEETVPATGDGTPPTLWLSTITHSGSDTTAGGSAVTLPPVTFTGTMLQNRVATHDGLPIMTRYRIGSITTETGEVIGVDYERVAPCSWPVTVTPSANTSSCYPVYWTPLGYSNKIEDWFNKWQVASVTQADLPGGAPTVFTSYTYKGGGAWHYDDNEVVKAKYRTYGQWRGFGDVQTFTGQGEDAQTETETTYYRGMSRDNDTTAVTLTDSQGGTHDDADQLAGDTLETTHYDFAAGPVTDSTINSYWVSAATASRDRTGLQPLTANATGTVETWSRQAITGSGSTTWRKTETDTSYDTDASSPTFGLPLVSFAHGDLSDTTQQRCTVTTYAPVNAGENLTGLPAEVETDAAACGGDNPGGASAPTTAQTNALSPPASVTRPDDVVSDQRVFYDNPALAATWPQPSSVSWPQPAPVKGDVSEVRVADDFSGGAFDYQVESATVYDSYGRPVDAYDPLGHKTHTDYTMANGVTTATKVTNPLQQAVTQTLDPLRGTVTSVTDANGITTTTHYDGLGRTTAVWGYGRATTSPANAVFSYQVSVGGPTAVTTQTLNDAGGYVTSTTLFDALLRPRQTQKPTPAGGRLISDTFYDTRGWVWKKNTDWWDASSNPGTTVVSVPDSQVPDQDVIDFDGAGRPVLDTSYDDSQVKSKTATAYHGDKTITVPLNTSDEPYDGATATATVTDALGRTTELDSYTQPPTVAISTQGSPPITSVAITGGTSQATRYAFDHVGHQTDVEDVTTGEDWNSGYNLLGQVISKRDPDAGTSTMKYDPAGNLTQTTDGRGKTISFTYDPLNRKTGEYDAAVADQSPSNRLASWVYDNSNNAVPGMSNPIGQLTTETSYVDGNAYTTQAGVGTATPGFNAYGESSGETITLPSSEGPLAGSYTFTHRYTSGTALPDYDTYPASPGGGSLPAETTHHHYAGAMDFPIGISGLASYTANVTATPYGQAAQEELGLDASDHAFISNTFDEHTGALKDTKLQKTDTASPIDETSYTYDPAGNPTSQTETRNNGDTETQCYAYDALDRLTQAWTATDDCAADPATNNGSTVGSGIPGGAYWTSWKLDPLGQRTKQIQHGSSGAADTITSYTYNTSQPNTLHSTSTTGPNGASSSYGYDPAGNTTTRTTPATGQQTLTWSDTGQLTAVTGASNGSSYIYDADGALLLQKDPGTTTLYLPDEEIALNTTTGAITGTRFYALPGGGEAVRTGSGSAYHFETGDQHGTATLSLDNTLTTSTWREQDPYGNTRGTPPPTWPDSHGFLNAPQDTTTALTHIGARWYDPTIGRFASLDPLFTPASPQEQNGYTYAGSNPVTYSDPTGEMHDCNTGAGGCGNTGLAWGSNTPGPCDIKDCSDRSSTNREIIASDMGGGHGHIPSLAEILGYTPPPCDATCFAKNFLGGLVDGFVHATLGMVVQGGKALVSPICAITWSQACESAIDGGARYLQKNIGHIHFFGDVHNPDYKLGDFTGKYILPLAIPVAGEESDAVAGVRGIRAAARRIVERGCKNSFAGDTEVPLADGTSKPIDEIKVGDKITDALPGVDPGTPDQTHTVTAVHITHTDRDYTDVTIATPTGPHTITGTSHHLYWDTTTRAWTPADQLHPGDELQTSNGQHATITALRSYNATIVTYNLTVDGLHTYYVEAGAVPVLVHNAGDCGGIALGIRKEGGLRDFAESRGFTHFLDSSRDEALGAVRDTAFYKPGTRIHITLDGFDHADDPALAFKTAYERGAGNNWYTTEREMRIVGESVRRGYRDWSSITFYHGGNVVDIPLPGYLGG